MQQIMYLHPTYLMNGYRLTSSLINLKNPIRCFFPPESSVARKMDGKNVQPKAMATSAGTIEKTYPVDTSPTVYVLEFLDPGLEGEVSSGVSSIGFFLGKIR